MIVHHMHHEPKAHGKVPAIRAQRYAMTLEGERFLPVARRALERFAAVAERAHAFAAAKAHRRAFAAAKAHRRACVEARFIAWKGRHARYGNMTPLPWPFVFPRS